MFDRLIFKEFVGIVWVLGTIAISVGSIAYAVNASSEGDSVVLAAGLMLIFGNFVWRLVCEILILGFLIHDAVLDVRALLTKHTEYVRTSGRQAPREPWTLEIAKPE